MSPRVYVAAAYEDAPRVRELHERMRSLGLEPTSTWAETARGAEDFAKFTPEELRACAEANDRQITTSNAMLVLARHGVGGETFAEARLAIDLGIPVLWVGRFILSAYREGSFRFEDVDSALGVLVGLQSEAS